MSSRSGLATRRSKARRVPGREATGGKKWGREGRGRSLEAERVRKRALGHAAGPVGRLSDVVGREGSALVQGQRTRCPYNHPSYKIHAEQKKGKQGMCCLSFDKGGMGFIW